MSIDAFSNLWNRDTSEDKSIARSELSLLFFMYNPTSEYQYETNTEKRLSLIKSHMGIPNDWVPDEEFNEAVEVYRYFTYTTSASILEGNRIAVNSIREVLETPIDQLDLSAGEKLVYVEKLAKTVNIVNKLAEDIAKAEKAISRDVEEHSKRMRGNNVRTIGDEGLGKLF